MRYDLDTATKESSAVEPGAGFAKAGAAFWQSVGRAPRLVVVACCVAAAGIALAVGAGRGGRASGGATGAAPPPVVTVDAVRACLRPLGSSLLVTGSISAWDPLSIGSEVAGLRIENVLVEEGENVRAGQVLAVLNSSVLRASLEESRAKLRAAEAGVSKSIQPNRPEEISVWRAALAQAEAAVAQEEANLAQEKADLANAQHTAERYRDLLRDGAVSAQDAENRETAAVIGAAQMRAAEQKLKASRFALEQARNRLNMAVVGGRSEDVAISRAHHAEMKASVDRLQAQVAQTVIRAPADGLVVKRDAHIGDITVANKPLFSIARSHRLELRALVPELDLVKVKPGQPVAVSTGGMAGPALPGAVREVSPLVDSGSRMGTVRIDLPADAGLKVGMFVRATIDLGRRDVVAVPARALLTRESHTYVMVLDNDRARARPVVTGARDGDMVEITAGLSKGEDVIISGAGFLKDGDPVRVAGRPPGMAGAR